MVEKLFPDPFLKNQKWVYLNGQLSMVNWVDQWSTVLYGLFLLHAKLRAIKKYWNQAPDQLLLQHVKYFEKTKRGL